MPRWFWRGVALTLAICACALAGLAGCASSGQPQDSDRQKRDQQRRDSPFYVPFSA